MNRNEIICLCSFVTTKEIEKLLAKNKTIFEIQEKTNLGRTCGKCMRQLRQLTSDI